MKQIVFTYMSTSTRITHLVTGVDSLILKLNMNEKINQAISQKWIIKILNENY